MPLDTVSARELIKQLQVERDAYLASYTRTQELLLRVIEASASATSSFPVTSLTTAALDQANPASIEVESIGKERSTGSLLASEDWISESDENESLFVQEPLEPEVYDLEGLRKHISTYPWTPAGLAVINNLNNNKAFLRQDCLLPLTLHDAMQDRSAFTHASIYDVGPDGAPLETRTAGNDATRAMEIWNQIKGTNADASRERPCVGKIVIVREPSPSLMAALHYTMNKHFDVDELLLLLVDKRPKLAYPHRAFESDHRRQRSFIVSFEYFTIIGEDCKPPKWQRPERYEDMSSENPLPITRCSSVIALSFEGKAMSRVKNRDRRVDRKFGEVYDPFSPWRVLSIQAYPDWESKIDAHDSTKHYVNGPEAFLVTLRAEFRDARARLSKVYTKVAEIVEPPADFIFNPSTRDKLLFEDDHFTFSRRYFWAYQTLGIMSEDIHEMITCYNETFSEGVWEGTNKIIWPGEATASSRHTQWRKRMARLKADLEFEITKLKEISSLNDKKMQDIKALRDNLFSGTSVLESRRSVLQAAITVEQGRNIKLLTLVTIFFLPLTFVSSIFGMTNMPQNVGFAHFGWSTLAICLPTYILIGSLNTTEGLKWWTTKYYSFWNAVGAYFARLLVFLHYKPKWTNKYNSRWRMSAGEESGSKSDIGARPPMMSRYSSNNYMTARLGGTSTPVADNPGRLIRTATFGEAQQQQSAKMRRLSHAPGAILNKQPELSRSPTTISFAGLMGKDGELDDKEARTTTVSTVTHDEETPPVSRSDSVATRKRHGSGLLSRILSDHKRSKSQDESSSAP